jgi:butyryl-CoA dehydrogenase
LDRKRGFPRESLRKLADVGLLGMVIPPNYGGGGADSLSCVLALEAIAGACASTALVLFAHSVASLAISSLGSDLLKNKYLPFLAKGERLAAVAHTEPHSGVSLAAIEATAKREGEDYIINGTKHFITNAGQADVYLVFVKTDGSNELSVFVVEDGAPGMSYGRRHEMMGLRGSSEGELVFENCYVPGENLLGQEGGGLKVVGAYLNWALLGAAAISLGIAQSALDASIGYAKDRVIAGRPIGAYQAIQSLIAEMSTSVEAGRAMLYMAALSKDRALPGSLAAAFRAKLYASEMAVEVTNKALQLHGGHGYCQELPIERYYRDARGLTLHVGTSETLKEGLGKMLIGLA